ncbi:MAG: O-Antigen ligase [Candidatus Scalindua rubra]|uniref:O-Antigen ligase n=1 Tax=Candidatus Scalindua rubra TaxID=1872076 RepID=A0A1E3X4P9_9BACT|nr:MAG: O-Antigen ligase [Candidatus Scalindua rubra]
MTSENSVMIGKISLKLRPYSLVIPIWFLELTLLLYVFILPIWPEYAVIKIGKLPGINLQRILIMGNVLLWIFGLIINPVYRSTLYLRLRTHTGIIIIISLFFLWKYISVIPSSMMIKSIYAATNELIIWYLLFFIGLTVFVSPRQVWRFLSTIVLAGIVISLVGIYEAVTDKIFFAEYVPVWSEYTKQALSHNLLKEHRIQATFANTLSLAQFMIIMLPLAVTLIVKSKSIMIRLMAAVASLLGPVVIWFTQSRSPIVVVVLLLALYVSSRILKKVRQAKGIVYYRFVLVFIPVIIIAVAVSSFILFTMIIGRTETESLSTLMRVSQLYVGGEAITQQPLFGYGPALAAIEAGIGMGDLPTIDNYYLTLMIESGIPALIIFVVIIVYFIRLGIRLFLSNDKEISFLGSAIVYALVGFTIFILILSLKVNFPIIYLFMAMLIVLDDYGKTSKGFERKE